ncbi:YdcF family protein [Novosphingopyxis sp.]|uniref:YdcF family protein n=1 Tax=Novosphingopyxis sp. TaxID=2709690 RepID=UPI003B5A4F1A
MIARILSVPILAWLLGFAWFALLLPEPAAVRKTDAVVVLTGGAHRIDRGLAVLKAGEARYMLISGVDPDVRPDDLEAEYDWPKSLEECCIDLGFRSVDTRSNATETARWAARRDVRSIRLVTSDWHMRRAELELANALPDGVSLTPDAVPTRPSFAELFREYNKYWLRFAASLLGI